ncbi:MAG: SAM-dependent chlorinase/fluorinase [Sphingobacteriaceae bacterium]|nr:SAM-dependent chlorinase/fluorinase [Sphingobacteriaceae bacterium]
MAIITLTTDLGSKDFYQAALKGSILSNLNTANIVDISHEIPKFDISNAAFVLKNAFPYFPEKTVHLIGIDSVYNEDNKYVAIKYKNHYFVGADSGIFSILFDEEPEEIVEISIVQNLKFLHFPLLDILVKAATSIAEGKKLSEIGTPLEDIKRRMLMQPIVSGNIIRGVVIYIDSFNNVITNITKDLFASAQKGRNFVIHLSKHETINQLSWHYNEVTEGEKLCLFGLSNHLEIAINKGKANTLLGLPLGQNILIEFED